MKVGSFLADDHELPLGGLVSVSVLAARAAETVAEEEMREGRSHGD